ncbi:MAG: sigma-70 family RNA polymerase sigma factor [Tenuifilaceae bacterium]|jgi:RNA polymerase sigma-70 factor (ECF subfamily)|nr:sigma-70 family RNA polymerase sigma factor [Tenuifilaceae bacterium]
MAVSSRDEDLVLLKGCLDNDRRLQKQLYQKFFKGMFQICLSYSGDRSEAKDILQDAFIKVFTSLESFNPNNSLEGWIRRIVTNTAIDYFRKKKRLVFLDEFPDEPDEEERGNFSFQELTNEVILFHIKKLPDGARVVFNLFAVEGLQHKEIAERLGITEGTSKSQYMRARNLLKKWLYEYELSKQ